MNFVVSLVQLLLAAVLYFTPVKNAHIPKEGERGRNDVVPFMEVYNKSYCRPRETLVDIYQEYQDDTEPIYIPSCVVLMRCAGCCNDEALECVPTETRNVTLEVIRSKLKFSKNPFLLSFTEHRKCDCRQKAEVKAKKEKGKGQKRKRKKGKDTDRIAKAEAYASAAVQLSVGTLSLLGVGWILEEIVDYLQ